MIQPMYPTFGQRGMMVVGMFVLTVMLYLLDVYFMRAKDGISDVIYWLIRTDGPTLDYWMFAMGFTGGIIAARLEDGRRSSAMRYFCIVFGLGLYLGCVLYNFTSSILGLTGRIFETGFT